MEFSDGYEIRMLHLKRNLAFWTLQGHIGHGFQNCIEGVSCFQRMAFSASLSWSWMSGLSLFVSQLFFGDYFHEQQPQHLFPGSPGRWI